MWQAFRATSFAHQQLVEINAGVVRGLLNARFYNPNQGQFISEDPSFLSIGDPSLIDITPKSVCNNLVPGKYCGDFQIDGEPKTLYYDSPEQVPTYLIIDTKTGNERFYANLNEASQADRAIFELLTR